MTATPSPRPGVFLVGTDTGVGKTALGVTLLTLALRRGLSPVPFKPVETGCAPLPADAHCLLAASARTDLSLAEVCPFPFAAPVAPAQAAAEAGTHLSLSTLTALVPALARRGNFLLVESAGGLLSPYALDFTGADLAAASALPVLLVARNALGTVNHTSLAVAEIRRRDLPFAGVILMETSDQPTPDRRENARLIEAVSGTRPLACLPFVRDADPALLADELARQLDVRALFERLGVPPT
jgi:dethiobiotin synthetase